MVANKSIEGDKFSALEKNRKMGSSRKPGKEYCPF
jgi:hypothetical protein